MTIRILPEALINRIAAGEVIERPASAVKELAENAIDAGATRIEVTLEQAGKNRIVVQDNGKGMRKEELRLAVQRHATSKLPSDDLLDIHFLGFRGEALPSIGSVSRMTIMSRAKDSEAWKIFLEGGDIGEPEPVSLAHGTRIEVRDLFYATPARLKFLKSDRTEAQQAADVLTRLAMANPQIAFSLTNDGKRLIHVEAADRKTRIGDLLGADFTENAMELNHRRENVRLTGFVSLPTYHRGTSAEQYLFVGGRPVRDRLLLGALKGAYQDVLAHDRYPVAALFLELPKEEVDVNAHPAKTEVRFRDSALVRGMIVGAVRNALAEAGFRSASTNAAEMLARFAAAPAAPVYAYAHEPPMQQGFIHELPPLAKPAEYQWHEEGAPDYRAYPLGAARCQLHLTYIVAETLDGLVVVDQHAAHERLVLEKMKEGLAKQGIERQKLLLPEVVSLKADLAEALLSRREELLQFGLAVEGFGDGTLVVREIPSLLSDCDVSTLVRDMADNLLEFGEALALKEKIGHICATMACHGSIRAGRSLSVAEMNALLRQMEKTPLSGQCNHGRPTHIVLKRTDIESLFGR